MNGLIKFIKGLFGFEDPKECRIGLAHLDDGDLISYDKAPKKTPKQELTLSQMLRKGV